MLKESVKHRHEHEHDTEQVYYHDHGDGHVHSHPVEHEQDPDHTHTHGHVHTQTKAVLNRLSRAIGHLESVRRMVEEGRDCTEVLVQLAAVRSALNNTSKIILQDHVEHCLADAVESGDLQSIEELNKAIEKLIT
jgi:DNA-binding FrmR family transcriptional regulator